MKRDQFGRDIRKQLNNTFTSDEIFHLYRLYNEKGCESINEFIILYKDEFGFKPIDKNQIQNSTIKKTDFKKPGKANPKKPKEIQPISAKGQKIKNAEAQAMQKFWDSKADYRGWALCEEALSKGEIVWLRGYAAYYVHHIWTKGANPASRFDPENFIIVSAEVHNQIHNEGETDLNIYPVLMQRRKALKLKYAKLAMLQNISLANGGL